MSIRKLKKSDIEKSISMTIGERLKYLRNLRGLTQLQLAKETDCTREAIAAYESGRVKLGDEIIIRFAKALKITTDELLGVTEGLIEETSSLRIMRRVKKIEQLPPLKQKAILQTLDMALQNVSENSKS